ncbi:unnamed protein product, partial [Durusdinium trenchii]
NIVQFVHTLPKPKFHVISPNAKVTFLDETFPIEVGLHQNFREFGAMLFRLPLHLMMQIRVEHFSLQPSPTDLVRDVLTTEDECDIYLGGYLLCSVRACEPDPLPGLIEEPVHLHGVPTFLQGSSLSFGPFDPEDLLCTQAIENLENLNCTTSYPGSTFVIWAGKNLWAFTPFDGTVDQFATRIKTVFDRLVPTNSAVVIPLHKNFRWRTDTHGFIIRNQEQSGFEDSATVLFETPLPDGATFADRCEFACNTEGWAASDEVWHITSIFNWMTPHIQFLTPVFWDSRINELVPCDGQQFGFPNNSISILAVLIDNHWAGIEVVRLAEVVQILFVQVPAELQVRLHQIIARIFDLSPSMISVTEVWPEQTYNLCGWTLLKRWSAMLPFEDWHEPVDLTAVPPAKLQAIQIAIEASQEEWRASDADHTHLIDYINRRLEDFRVQTPLAGFTDFVVPLRVGRHWVQCDVFTQRQTLFVLFTNSLPSDVNPQIIAEAFGQLFAVHESNVTFVASDISTPDGMCGWSLLKRLFDRYRIPIPTVSTQLTHALSESQFSQLLALILDHANPDWADATEDTSLRKLAFSVRVSFLRRILSKPGPAEYMSAGAQDADATMTPAAPTTSPVDPLSIHDPWAQAIRQSSKWEDLKLQVGHPFVDSANKSIPQIHRLQASKSRGGVILASKGAIADIMKSQPPAPSIIVMPAADVAVYGPFATRVHGPYEVVLDDPKQKSSYKRLVQYLLLEGDIKFALPKPTCSFTTPPVSELVFELDSRCADKSLVAFVQQQPLNHFREKAIELLGAATVEAAQYYGFRVNRNPPGGDGATQLQCIVKVPTNQLISASGATSQIFVRDFLDR